jgi:SAM-dependent methyltransferase
MAPIAPDAGDPSRATLEHYSRRAVAFEEGTRDHDVSQNIAALLRAIEGDPPFTILDFGCGPGRDLQAFAALGHAPVGLDGAEPFVAMARSQGQEVWHQDFLALDLPAERFDGVFANAALFHVPSAALPRVLLALRATLKPRGVLFSSNPRGNDEEGWNRGATACITASRPGAATCSRRVSPKSNTTIGRRASRATSNPGSPAYGASNDDLILAAFLWQKLRGDVDGDAHPLNLL